jgi:undecaprenyl-diphosphatase
MYWRIADLRVRLEGIALLWLALVGTGIVLTVVIGDTRAVEMVSHSRWVAEHYALIHALTKYSMYPFYVLFLVVLILGWLRRDKYLRLIGWAYLFAQLAGAAFTVRILKILTGHARPSVQDPAMIDAWVGPSMDNAFHSFPSGHTADLFTSAVFLAILAPNLLLRIVLLAFAVLIGLTRIALSGHYPVDVTGGAMIGGLTTLLVVAYWLFPRLADLEQGAQGSGG